MLRYLWSRLKSLHARYGVLGGLLKLFSLKKIYRTVRAQKDYQKWIEVSDTLSEKRERLEHDESQVFSNRPLLSVILPVYKSRMDWLKECVNSVLQQSYDRWELCISDDASKSTELSDFLKSIVQSDSRVKVFFRDSNGHICANTNSALGLATGDYVAFLDHDDKLHASALFEVVKFLNSREGQEADFIYTDEDKFDESGSRSEPSRKFEFQRGKLYECMFTGHLAVYRRSLVEKLVGLRLGFEGAQDWDLLLRASELPIKICHLPKILYHWRKHAESTSDHPMAKPYAHEASRKAILEAFERRGLRVVSDGVQSPGFYRWKIL